MKPQIPQSSENYSFFVYTVTASGMLVDDTGTASFTVQADSDFEWLRTTFAFFNGDGATNLEYPNFTVTIQDTGSSVYLTQIETPIFSIAGKGELPFILPQPRIFKSRANVNVQWTNSVAGISTFYMNFIGRKIYR